MVGTVTAALDVMGGDAGADMVLPGAEIAAERIPGVRYVLFGDAASVEPLLARYPKLGVISSFEHCDLAIGMEDKPGQALRRGRGTSSMWRAIETVKDGKAGVAVSAGNTGALMAMSKFCLKDAKDIDRPAIAAVWPTLKGESVVLDVGATIGATSEQLYQFAVMGAAMSRALLGRAKPTVGLLNIGVEEVKGLEQVRLAGRLLKEAELPFLDYAGFVEGDDIGKGAVDVIVTEGFAGNIALKTAEGTARQIAAYLRETVEENLMSRLGFLLARRAFGKLRKKLDTRRMNGGVFLGLNGLVIKSHGGTDAEGFAAAIEIGCSMARNGIVEKINEDVALHRPERPAVAVDDATSGVA